jgi:hypothetical protein
MLLKFFLCFLLLLNFSCGGKTFTKQEAEICDIKAASLQTDNASGYDKECNLYNGKMPDVTMIDKTRTFRLLLTPILLPLGVIHFSRFSLNSQIHGTCIAKGFSNFYSKQIGNTYYGWCTQNASKT